MHGTCMKLLRRCMSLPLLVAKNLVSVLRQAKADLKIVSKVAGTPLHATAVGSYVESVEMIIAHEGVCMVDDLASNPDLYDSALVTQSSSPGWGWILLL